MRVMALPAFLNRASNPYNALLYSAVARAGVGVDDFSVWKLLVARPDVLHVHWPDYFFSAPRPWETAAKALGFVLLIGSVRLRRTPVVWTVHNLRAHEQRHARLEARLWRWFVRRIDGYIALTAGGQAAALARFPTLGSRPGFVIPHGHYRDEYPDQVGRDAARADLGLPHLAPVVCFLGAIRSYKNVPELVDAFRLVSDPAWRLVIAGKPSPADLGPALAGRAAAEARIRLDLEFVPRERVQLYLRAADLLVFPYRDVLNSGSALLALSFGRPILVPERGAMAELRQTVGAEWVRTYWGELRAETLVEAMAWATTTPRDERPVLRELDWDEIANQTVLAYKAVRRRRAATPWRLRLPA